MNIGSIFKGIGNFFVGLFKEVEPAAEQLVVQAFEDFENKLTPDVVKIATDAVALVPAALSGTAARDAAVATIKADFEKTGIDLKDWAESEYNLLVELAYKAFTAAGTAAAGAASGGTATGTAAGSAATTE